jgi:ribosomal protein L10
VITIPIEGVSKEDTDFLRKALPKTTTASVVKNAIFKKVIQGTQFEPLAKTIRDETMYLFVPEGDAKSAYDAYKKWQKDFKRFVSHFTYSLISDEIILHS